MHRRRVAITGVGIISPLGRGVSATIEAARKGTLGIRRIELFDPSSLICQVAGEVTTPIEAALEEHDRFVGFALIAAEEAARQSNLEDPALDRNRIATLVGTGLGGSQTLDAAYERLYGRHLTRLRPATIPRAMYNAATSAVARAHRARGPSFAIVSACASGTHAIGQAANWIRAGLADIAIAGGSDAPITPGVMHGWEALRILANDEQTPERACRPFSADRSGLLLGEGSAVFILEDLESARRRGVRIVGEVMGAGFSSDAGHLTDPSPDGAVRAMRMALDDAGLAPEQIELIKAHGTGTRANDPAETAAIRTVFGAHADRVVVSSTKAMHGHSMGASGAIETAIALVAANTGFVAPTINFTVADPECDLDYVPNEARQLGVTHFLSNALGFGGMNGSLAIATRNATG